MNASSSFVVINAATPGLDKTVIVFGAGRGGTSAVAGCLRELGVAMPLAHPLKHEWSPLCYDGDTLLAEKSRASIAALNRQHPVWGWKSPRDLFHFSQFVSMLRNPHVIAVFRDPVETSRSIQRRERLPIEIGLEETTTVYRQISDLVSFSSFPLALCSYGRIVADPAGFVDSVNGWLGLGADAEALRHAVDFIAPEQSYRSLAGSSQSGDIDREELDRDQRDSWNAYVPKSVSKLTASMAALQNQILAAENQIGHMKDRLYAALHAATAGSDSTLDNSILYQLFTLPIDEFAAVIRPMIPGEATPDDPGRDAALDAAEPTEAEPAAIPAPTAPDATAPATMAIDHMQFIYERTRADYIALAGRRGAFQVTMDDLSHKIELVHRLATG